MNDVLEIVNKIKNDIQVEKISVKEQYDLTEYYERRINRLKQCQQIVIFGAGNYGRLLYKMLIAEGLQNRVCAFADNGSYDTQIDGIQIFSISEAICMFPDATYVITPKSYEDEIISQLIELGVSYKKISTFIVAYTGLEKMI